MNDTAHAHAPLDAADVFADTCGIIDGDAFLDVLNFDLYEDQQPNKIDITSWAMVDPRTRATAQMNARQPGRLAGLNIMWALAQSVDPRIAVTLFTRDGEALSAGDKLAVFTGPLTAILLLERTALNLVTHLSGVATLAAAFVDAVAGTKAVICDTRKTLPGLRRLQKYAAECGGVTPHRYGLSDGMLVKDNHLAGVPLGELADTLAAAAKRARRRVKNLTFVEVEVDTLEQLAEVLKAPIDIALLDNMTHDQLREAVAMRDAAAPAIQLEASGGVNLDTVRPIADTGVDRISVGAITHSAPALDVGLDIAPTTA